MIKNRFKLIRIQRDLIQREVQKGTGIDQCYLSKIERGDVIPLPKTTKRFADFYGLPIEYFLTENQGDK